MIGLGSPPLCAVQAVVSYLACRSHRPGPLFLLENGLPLTRLQVTDRLRAIALSAGLPGDFSSHSFRIGAATSAARAGVPDHLIQVLGRWKSDAYKQYIRTPPYLITRAAKALVEFGECLFASCIFARCIFVCCIFARCLVWRGCLPKVTYLEIHCLEGRPPWLPIIRSSFLQAFTSLLEFSLFGGDLWEVAMVTPPYVHFAHTLLIACFAVSWHLPSTIDKLKIQCYQFDIEFQSM